MALTVIIIIIIIIIRGLIPYVEMFGIKVVLDKNTRDVKDDDEQLLDDLPIAKANKHIVPNRLYLHFYPRDAMLARVFATATCPSVCPSVCPSHAGIVTSRAKAGS